MKKIVLYAIIISFLLGYITNSSYITKSSGYDSIQKCKSEKEQNNKNYPGYSRSNCYLDDNNNKYYYNICTKGDICSVDTFNTSGENSKMGSSNSNKLNNQFDEVVSSCLNENKSKYKDTLESNLIGKIDKILIQFSKKFKNNGALSKGLIYGYYDYLFTKISKIPKYKNNKKISNIIAYIKGTFMCNYKKLVKEDEDYETEKFLGEVFGEKTESLYNIDLGVKEFVSYIKKKGKTNKDIKEFLNNYEISSIYKKAILSNLGESNSNNTNTTKKINGECGDSYKKVFNTKPAKGLCKKGVPSLVRKSGSSSWSWLCKGENGGYSKSCFAYDGNGYINLVNGMGIEACNKQIKEHYGYQKYRCYIGGGCSISGGKPNSTNPSANPKSAGVCIKISDWFNNAITKDNNTNTTKKISYKNNKCNVGDVCYGGIYLGDLVVYNGKLDKYYWDGANNFCDKLNYSGYNDWYLPSYDELFYIYDKGRKLGVIPYGGFWSSSFSTYGVWYVTFSKNGGKYRSNISKNYKKYYTLCIRRVKSNIKNLNKKIVKNKTFYNGSCGNLNKSIFSLDNYDNNKLCKFGKAYDIKKSPYSWAITWKCKSRNAISYCYAYNKNIYVNIWNSVSYLKKMGLYYKYKSKIGYICKFNSNNEALGVLSRSKSSNKDGVCVSMKDLYYSSVNKLNYINTILGKGTCLLSDRNDVEFKLLGNGYGSSIRIENFGNYKYFSTRKTEYKCADICKKYISSHSNKDLYCYYEGVIILSSKR